MATAKQIELFNRLVDEREFPPAVNANDIKGQFVNVPDKSASDWIERALALPEKGEVPPPF